MHAPLLVQFLVISSTKFSVQLQCCVSCRRNFRRMASVTSFFYGAAAQRGLWPSHSWGFKITHNDAPHSVGFLWSGDQLVADTSTWHNTHKGQTSMLPVGFEPTIPAGERPQTYALDRAATWTGYQLLILSESVNIILCCNLIVAPSIKKLPTCFWKRGCNKIPSGTYSEPGGSSIHPSVLF